MNKEFIPYKQALELKELGFDELCGAGYFESNNDVYLWYCKETKNSDKIEIEKDEFAMAPLYQQAFRWFREKQFIMSYIYYDVEYKFCFCIGYNDKIKGFKTYEEAELACLNKLIEIIKNKFGGLEK